METVKTRQIGKMPSKVSNSTIAGSKKQQPDQKDQKFNENDKKTIAELKLIYLDTIQLDVQLQREIYNLEKSFENKHNEIFDKRNKILADFRKKSHGNSATTQGPIANFWLKVLKSSYTEFISKKDEKILAHLTDIRSKLHNDPIVKFVIEFSFEPNEYFSNGILTKAYFLNCLPDIEDPLTYDGAEIFKCEGCQIEWKNQDKEKDKKAFSSFFDFFNPPILPDNPEDPNYCDINAILQNDFELGFYLKERVIPKAIIFFTGEIADCQSSDSDTDDTDEDDDDDDDDDNSSGNEAGDN